MKHTRIIMVTALMMLAIISIASAVPPGLPMVNFTGVPTIGPAPLSVDFTSVTQNVTLIKDSWSFGDGWQQTQISDPTITHVYQNPGKYGVTLEASNLIGSLGYTMSKTSYIIVTHVKPVAAFTYTVNHAPPAAPLNVSFDSSTTTGEHVEYSWDFGDGATSSLANPKHLYTSEGAYTVLLTAGNDGGSTTATHVVTVLPVKPDAHIGADSTTVGPVPLAVQFRDDSTGIGINAWNWSFGDGLFSNVQNPLHAYGTKGTFDVQLIVTSPSGSDTTMQYHYVLVKDPVGPTVCPTPTICPTPTVCPTPVPLPTVNELTSTGVFRSGSWFIRNINTTAIPNINFVYGDIGDVPLLGDWNGDGIVTPGVFRHGNFYLRNTNDGGTPDILFAYGTAGDVPVVGDWDADGVDTIGVIRNGIVYLRNSNTNGMPDITFGVAGDIPVIS